METAQEDIRDLVDSYVQCYCLEPRYMGVISAAEARDAIRRAVGDK